MRITFACLLLCCSLASFGQLSGKVVAITDGDTFTLLSPDNKQIKIRLHGIDCPENGQPYASVAQDFLGDHIFGKQVSIEVKNTDRYGRTIGIVWQQKKNINELLLSAGLAWHYKQYDKSVAFAKLEQQARKHRIGLWQQEGALAPWAWRGQRKNN